MGNSIRKRRLACILSLFFFITGFSFPLSYTSDVFLIIHSYNIEYQWTADIQNGILDAMHESGKPLLVCTEFMDWKRFPSDKYIEPFSRFLSDKYSPKNINAVIVSDDRALEFVIEYRQSLFPDIPIIFCGVHESVAKKTIGSELGVTGIYEKQSVERTIETALKIQANPRAAYLISDLDPSGQSIEQKLREALSLAAPALPVRSLSDMTITNIEQTVSALGKKDLVFIGSYSIDKTGLVYTGETLIERVAKASETPVFVLNTHHLGSGSLGGYLFSPYVMGKKTGELALKVLSGTPVDSIPPHHDSAYVMLFDHQAVKRFSITTLPKEATFINKQASFWEQHRITAYISLLIFSLCLSFIIVLLYFFRRTHTHSRDLAQKNAQIGRLNKELYESSKELSGQVLQLSAIMQTLEKSEERYRMASIGSNDALWDWNYERQTTHYSDRWYEITGFSSKKNAPLLTDVIHPDDRDRYGEAVREHINKKTDKISMEVRVGTASGSWKWIDIRGKAVRNERNEISHITGSITDIEKRKAHEAEVETLAYYDPLTSLPNRMNAIRICQEMIDETGPNEISGVIFVNIHNFTLINNMFGHTIGDKVLVTTATILSSLINEHIKIARFGGDQFVLFISATSTSFMEKYAQLVIRLLTRKMEIEGRFHYLSVTAGVALFPDHAKTVEDLFQKADAALNRAKILAIPGYALYDESIQEDLSFRLEIETGLRTAIENNELYVAYQPQIDLSTGKINGLEALARWNYPRRGEVSPGLFIPIAEETGQIDKIGFFIVQAAVDFIKRAIPLGHTDFTVSVNVSIRQMQASDFVHRIIHFVEKSGVSPSRINLELTESFLIEGIELMAEKLHLLKNAGFLLSLDDFGKGYSSLSYLKELPVHFVKIDKVFVDGIITEEKTRMLAKSIITLSHSLGLKVVAEGVEDEDQYLHLKKMHCDIIQGYYFSRPVSEEKALDQMELSFT
ncbi:MAG TPA: EAL domain-containing protein [Treponema sp.]|nr:EAL domain-containing protein [Treponema sp.]